MKSESTVAHDPPASTANLTSTDLDCRSIWEVINICGGDGKDLEACICKYKFIWDPQIGTTGSANDCPTVIEQAGDSALGGRVRDWQSFACGTSPWVHMGGTSPSGSSSSTTPAPTPSSAASGITKTLILYVALMMALAGIV